MYQSGVCLVPVNHTIKDWYHYIEYVTRDHILARAKYMEYYLEMELTIQNVIVEHRMYRSISRRRTSNSLPVSLVTSKVAISFRLDRLIRENDSITRHNQPIFTIQLLKRNA